MTLGTSDEEKRRPSFETRKTGVPVEFILSPPSIFVSTLAAMIYCLSEVIYEIGKQRGSRILASPMQARSRRTVHSVTVT
jgi:hypothetical protein